ncbi:hypothetical protein ES708_30982 [subsurface metagenome]
MGAKADNNPLHHDKAAEWGAAEHAAIGDAAPHHAKTTSFTELTDRAGKEKLNWAQNKLLLGAGPDADPTEIDLPVGGYTEGARAYHSLDQSIPNNTATALAFNSERYDTDAIHDPVTNNSRLTCKTAGIYLIVGQATFYTSIYGERYITIVANGGTDLAAQQWATPQAGWNMMHVSTIYNLAVDDYVELVVYHTRGNSLDILSWGNYTPEFMMQRIG